MTVNVVPKYDNYGHEEAQDISKEEIDAYCKRALEKFGDRVERLDLKLDGEFVDISYHLKALPFERIRRITGYLVGNLSRWNNAKLAEEKDRVKHDV